MSSEGYSFADEMAEISGFGGDYEAACRAMVTAGVAWLDEHPDADLAFETVENATGIVTPETLDAEELAKRMADVVEAEYGDPPSGAMMEACVGHVVWIEANGWDAYVERMEAKESDD